MWAWEDAEEEGMSGTPERFREAPLEAEVKRAHHLVEVNYRLHLSQLH